jgi:excisionase family DNA binding protein
MGKVPGRMNLGLTLDEVAERLHVHRETVAVWIRNGELRATKLGRGGKYWIQPRDVYHFVRGRRTK